MREFETSKKWAKAPRNLPSKSLTIPPQVERPGLSRDGPSHLNVVKFDGGGF